jgi:hypothetical protein
MACDCKVWIWQISTRKIVNEQVGSNETTAWANAEAYWADGSELNSAAGYFISASNDPICAFQSYTELTP